MISGGRLDEIVRIRARGRCEYCQMSQVLQGATFHVEHIVPRSLGGQTEAENLALACPGCNLRKADKTQAVDPKPRRRSRHAFTWIELLVVRPPAPAGVGQGQAACTGFSDRLCA